MTRPLAAGLLAMLAACATARPVDVREFGARGDEERRVLRGLSDLRTLQMVYQARNGRFATSVDELRRVGWEEADFGAYRPVVTDAGSRVCVAMLPTGERRPAWSMGHDGGLFRGARCGR
ncbi:MAG TPA: hypothetical protein VGB15_11230 [Longimicrobium sp.]